MKILSIADMHIICLRSMLKGKAYDRARIALESLLSKVWELRPDTIVISGDIFDSPYPNRDEIHLFMQFLLPLLSQELNVIIIPGNHESDRVGGKTALSFLEPFDKAIANFYLATHFRRITIDDISFLLYPWGAFPNLKDNDPDATVTIAVMHMPIVKTIISDSKRKLPKGFPLESLLGFIEAANIDYVLMGDIHEMQEIVKGKAWYPGAIYQTKFSESQSKGVLFLDTERDLITFHEIVAPKLITIALKELDQITPDNFYTLTAESKEDFFDLAQSELPDNIVKIDYPFVKRISVSKDSGSQVRKIGFEINLVQVLSNLFVRQGVDDIQSTMEYMLNFIDSENDLILP